MRIKSMTATFGTLQGATLTLGEGFQVIHASNEGGKSTWAAFIRAMFYGIDTKDRDKKGHIGEKNRYQPWSGAPMEGSMTLEWQGKDITIRRGQKGTVPFGAFSAVYTDTQEEVPGLTGDNCGELILGVGREVYERAALIGQGGTLTITSAPELERRIASIVSSGQEEVSYSQVERQLKDWLNRRKVNKSVGLIPKLEEELTTLQRSYIEAERINETINQTTVEQSALLTQKKALEQEIRLHKQYQQQKLNEKFAKAKGELVQAQEQLDTLHREQARFGSIPDKGSLKTAQSEMAFLKAIKPEIRQGEEALAQAQSALELAQNEAKTPYFPQLTGEEAIRQATEQVALWQQSKQREKKTQVLTRLMVGLGIVAGMATGGILLYAPQLVPMGIQSPLWIGMAAGTAVLLIAGVVSGIRTNKLKKSAEQILMQYNAKTPEEITALAKDYYEKMEAVERARQHMQYIYAGVEEKRYRRDTCQEKLFAFVHSFAPEVKDLFGCSAAVSRALNLGERELVVRTKYESTKELFEALKAQGGQDVQTLEYIAPPQRQPEETAARLGMVQSQLEQVERELHTAIGKQSSAGDPTELAARQEQVERELNQRKQEYYAITKAMEALKEANAQLQAQFSPALNQRAGQILAFLTNGAYRDISLDREMEAMAAKAGDVLPHRALQLSKGTIDQLYLAVRLALYDLCVGENRIPMVLDDALTAFDDERMGRALDLLLERAKQGQILLFTCQKREYDYLEKQAGAVHCTWL